MGKREFSRIKRKKANHLAFELKTTNLADLLPFSLYLIDNDNNKITFSRDEKKSAY